jgi:hypothetical protein
MIVQVECECCQGGKRPFKTAEGHPVPCPYCKGKGTRDSRVPHPSHTMGE